MNVVRQIDKSRNDEDSFTFSRQYQLDSKMIQRC